MKTKSDNFRIEFKQLVERMFESVTSTFWQPEEELDKISKFYEKFKTEINAPYDDFFYDLINNFRYYYFQEHKPTHCPTDIMKDFVYNKRNTEIE